jgi:hypothetical protein
MPKVLECEYTGDETLTADQIRLALSGDYEGFKYFFENCLLIQDRDTRQYIHPKMNAGQQMIAKAIFKNVDKKTRKNEHREIVVIGPRQFGKSTLFTAIGDYLPAYVPGMENLNTVHTLQTGTTAGKYFKQKIAPIVANVHPSIFPTIERDTLGTSTLLRFKDVKGIPRGGYYEITSAGSNSVRSGTVSVWLCDEPSEYRNPEMVEDAVSGAISSYAWSFTAYIGTFSDRLSNYFLNKIKLALDNPDEIELIFIPWFLVYGREGDGLGFTEEDLTEYDRDVIIPEMRKFGIPQSEWFDKLGWYHTRALRTSKMRYEFPSSIDDIINMTSDKLVFDERSIERQKKNILAGKKYRIVTDNATGRVEAQETEESPLTIFKEPIYGHRYRIAIDPITARSADTDNFVMQVMDLDNHEQVAVFRDRELQDEDYADWAVSIGTIYNKAQLCPEINVANGFIVAVNARRYYHWYYEDKKAKADRVPGLRTTVSTKEKMISSLEALLDRDNIIIHDEYTIEEFTTFVKRVKRRSDGTSTVKMEALKGHHDDDIAALWIYAGSLDLPQIEGRKRSTFAII